MRLIATVTGWVVPDVPPSHPDDELRGHALALADAVDAALPGWVERCVDRRCAGAGMPVGPAVAGAAAEAGRRCAADIGGQVRLLLLEDPDEQRSTPMTLLRRAVAYPTEVLAGAGVPEARRDDFARRNFPGDPYDLTPASFRDVDESLHEPGLAWGAAKAYVHLARRRSEGRS